MSVMPGWTAMKKYAKASMTIEMAVIAPMILFIIMGTILAAFYFHDKNIISGAAYETAVVGSTKAREKEGAKQGEIIKLFQERVKDKCILFSSVDVSVNISEEEIIINAKATKSRMKVSAVRAAKITEPEKYIREKRKWNGKLQSKHR